MNKQHTWHGFLLVERHNLGATNWTQLLDLFETMGTTITPYPAHHTPWCRRPDGDAVIYETRFSSDEVTMASFKQLLVEKLQLELKPKNIAHVASHTSYTDDGETVIWTFVYLGLDRFSVHCFGSGFGDAGTWLQSRSEVQAYLKANAQEWEQEE